MFKPMRYGGCFGYMYMPVTSEARNYIGHKLLCSLKRHDFLKERLKIKLVAQEYTKKWRITLIYKSQNEIPNDCR